MKRSTMLNLIADFMEKNNDEPFLTKQEAAEAFLCFVEGQGMYPPQAETKNNTEHFSMYVDNIDIPHWFTLGWDDE